MANQLTVLSVFLGFIGLIGAEKLTLTHPMIPGPAYVPGMPVKDMICDHGVSPHTMRANGLWSRSKTSTKRIVISGQIVNEDGAPVPDVRFEIWQPNSKGVYDMKQHECKGALLLDSDGQFYMNTEEPGSYGMTAGQIDGFDLPPWGVKHVHWLVYAPGYHLLVSQFALEWDPLIQYGDVDWRLVLAGSKYHDNFAYYDDAILKLAENATMDDDLIYTKPLKIVLRKRAEGVPPVNPDVTEELKFEECPSGENFWSELQLAVFVEPLNICHPDKEWFVGVFVLCILSTYAFVTIGIPIIIIRIILGFLRPGTTQTKKEKAN